MYKKTLYLISALCIPLILFFSMPVEAASFPGKWAVNYSENITFESTRGLDLLITCSAFIPPEESDISYIAYISVGEIHEDLPGFSRFIDSPGILQENPNWEGSMVWNWMEPSYGNFLYEELLPSLAERFSGFFLDTVDSALYYAPKKHQAEVQAALIRFIQKVRNQYPDHRIILNRGLEILPIVQKDIDALMIEDVVGGYDFENRNYQVQNWQNYYRLLRILQDIPVKIPVMALNYSDRDDWPVKVMSFYFSRSAGMSPSVAPIDLMTFDPDNLFLQGLSEPELKALLPEHPIKCLILYKSADTPVPEKYTPVQFILDTFSEKMYRFYFHDMSTGTLPPENLLDKTAVIVTAYKTPRMPGRESYIHFLRRMHFTGKELYIFNNLGCYFDQDADTSDPELLGLFLEPWGLEYHPDWISVNDITSATLPEGMEVKGAHPYTARKGASLYYLTTESRTIPVWHQMENGFFIQEGYFPEPDSPGWIELREIILDIRYNKIREKCPKFSPHNGHHGCKE